MKCWLVLLAVTSLFLSSAFGQDAGVHRALTEDVPSAGALCAIKKACQLTELSFSPLLTLRANASKEYIGGEKYKGMMYSSVKETNTFVGVDVSMHTFMTALHNPRSVIYTERTDVYPYHGVNCAAYYGVVCNTFVSYALGLKVPRSTFDFPSADEMTLVEDQSSSGVRLADVVHRKGHVMLVTRIFRDPDSGKAAELEISEAVRSGCRRVTMTGQELDDNISSGNWTLYRYRHLESNTYSPLTDFVALEGETLTPFLYNDDICTNRGDRSCYIAGDTVVLNVGRGYEQMEIYKDSVLFRTIRLGDETDIRLEGLPFGDYSARLTRGNVASSSTSWTVTDVQVEVDVKAKMVFFRSRNSVPVYLEFCDIAGSRPTAGVFELTATDLARGYADVSSFRLSSAQKLKGMYVKVHFQNSFGRVTNRPLKWQALDNEVH